MFTAFACVLVEPVTERGVPGLATPAAAMRILGVEMLPSTLGAAKLAVTPILCSGTLMVVSAKVEELVREKLMRQKWTSGKVSETSRCYNNAFCRVDINSCSHHY